MDQPPFELIPLWLLAALGVAGWACVSVWVVAAARWRQGLAVLPYQPRRWVPWGPIDLVLVLAVYVGTQVAIILLAEWWLGPELATLPKMYDVDEANPTHMVARLVAEGDLWVVLLCGLSAGVVAPIVEEFLFRLLLQGWLETAQRRWRRKMPTLQRLVPAAIGPTVLSSLLFARMHFIVERPMPSVEYLAVLLAGTTAASLLTLAFAVGLLRARVGATAADLGFVREKLFADVGLGLVAFVAVAGPIYAAQIVLALLLPDYLAPDPITLFFFALVLGTLYYRTHRIVPAIVAHMSLNATSLAMAWMLMAK